MSHARLGLVKQSLGELLSLPAERREAWLNHHCKGDAALRDELQSLLRAQPPDPPVSDAAILAPGELIEDRYRVGGWLGGGASSDVYLVHDRVAATTRALKITHAHPDLSASRLRQEARLASRIQSPFVCRVFEVFEHRQRACLLMEFVDGEDLVTLLAQAGRLPASRVLEIGRDLCEGLAAAHDLGIVHRDLKPSNVLIDRSGRVKIADFGVAAAVDEAPDGLVVGTPHYMAPEQLCGEGSASPRCDVYALATILFEAATGRRPFRGVRSSELAEEKRAAPASRPSRFCPEIDAKLEAAILAGLSPDPWDRPASGRGFAELLGARVEKANTQLPEREQRMVSVLSVGVAAISWGRAIERFRGIDLASRVLSAHGAHVASVSHSSVLAYFGFPRAMEDHSGCALRAARELVAKGAEEAGASGFSFRIGVETGEVVLDRVADASSPLAFGQPPEGADRLRDAADAGQVLVSLRSLRWTREPFAIRGEVTVGSPADPGGSSVAYRLDTKAIPPAPSRRWRGSSPFVGREKELAQLEAFWERAQRDRTQAVLITGEPGIGKSRLIRALRKRLLHQPCRWLELSGAPERRSSAFWPLRQFIEQDVELDSGVSRAERGGAAEEAFADGATRPARIRALVRLLRGSARGAPTLLICDDLQWYDPSTVEVIDSALAEREPGPLLLIAATRPGVAVPWAVDGRIPLAALEADEARRMLGALLADDPQRGQASEPLLERAQGVPLYIEALAAQEAWSGAAASGSTRVPAGLRGLLEARLDRLGGAKQVVQLGACLGFRFSPAHLLEISGLAPEELAEALDRLVGSGELRRIGERPGVEYEFAHALLAETAYEMLPDDQRREAHAAIAWMLAELEPESTRQHPEVLAAHLERAEVCDAAVEAWERAGHAAAQRAENIEARRHLERALALVSRVAPPERRDEVELRLRMALTESLAMINFSAFELEQNLERCGELIGDDSDARSVSVLVQKGRVQMLRGDLTKMSDVIERSLRELSSASGDLAVSLHSQNASYFTDYGDLARARHHHQKLLEIVPPDVAEMPSHPLALLGFAAAVPTDAWRLWYEGRFRAANARVQHWVPRISELPPFFAAASTGVSAPVVFLLGDLKAAFTLAHRLVDMSVALGFVWLETWAGAVTGSSLVVLGEWQDAVVELRTNLARMRTLGLKMFKPFAESFLANALVELGRLDEAEAVLESALDDVARGADRVWEPELHRVRGRLRARAGEPGEAERSLRHAVSLARERGIRALELKAATELSCWLREAGRPDEARAALAPICAAFDDELATPDVWAARRMHEG